MSTGWFCLHGHFYQPPRENPWIDEVQEEPSARPWHDWNERITAECYAPNCWARIYGPEGRLVEVLNNYSRMSLDFGSPLLRWLERKAPEVYRAIVEGDREAQRLFSGHGSAIAHPYSHIILPLAGDDDRRIAILWGIREFEIRFQRPPEAMWLPECAVDLRTLEDLASVGMRFVLLSPRQARRVRRPGGYWQDVGGSRIDPFRPYIIKLPSGRHIAAFFYHQGLSAALSFGDLLSDGERMLGRIHEEMPQGGGALLSICSDGETFGHHRPFGEMAVAYVLSSLKGQGDLRLTVFGEFLEKFPPEDEVEVFENSSWSCVHGLGRWQEDCGCNTGAHPHWNQRWRKPLREALNWLRDELRGVFKAGSGAFWDPLKAKEDYIEVLLNPSQRDAFLREHLRGGPPPRALGLLEMEREALLMFTSCGWFFDDPSGIETILLLKHASRAMDLAKRYGGADLEGEFLERIAEIESNLPEEGNGRDIYLKYVKPCRVDPPRAVAHLLIKSLFGDVQRSWGAFEIEIEREESLRRGKARLLCGELNLREDRLCERHSLPFSALRFGDHNVVCGLGGAFPSGSFGVRDAFEAGDFARAALLIREASGEVFTLASLLGEVKKEILGKMQRERMEEISLILDKIYSEWIPLIRLLHEGGFTFPPKFLRVAEYVLTERAERAIRELSGGLLRAVMEELKILGLSLDFDALAHGLLLRMEEFLPEMLRRPEGEAPHRLKEAVELSRLLPVSVPLGKVQAHVLMVLKGFEGDPPEVLKELAQMLGVEVRP